VLRVVSGYIATVSSQIIKIDLGGALLRMNNMGSECHMVLVGAETQSDMAWVFARFSIRGGSFGRNRDVQEYVSQDGKTVVCREYQQYFVMLSPRVEDANLPPYPIERHEAWLSLNSRPNGTWLDFKMSSRMRSRLTNVQNKHDFAEQKKAWISTRIEHRHCLPENVCRACKMEFCSHLNDHVGNDACVDCSS
jgi:hypothetical protein